MSDRHDDVVTAEEVAMRSPFQRFLSFAWGVLWRLALFVVVVILVRAFVVERFVIPTGSMLPTIQLDDVVLCEKVSYRFSGGPAAGDIIAFDDPTGSGYVLAKRVIATEGQEVDVRDGKTYVDGVEDPYAHGATMPQAKHVSYPLRVPEGKLWVMGDNRENSKDSRTFGVVDKSRVIGRFVFRVVPLSSFGPVS